MTTKQVLEEGIEIRVPAKTAYDQWTQFESFPDIMDNVDAVEQVDDETLRWTLTLGSETVSWTSRITEQIPDKRIAWKTVEGPEHGGVVTFHRLSDESCRVMVQAAFEPETFREKVGDKLGLVGKALRANLASFKEFLERRGSATGSWRGTIPSKDER